MIVDKITGLAFYSKAFTGPVLFSAIAVSYRSTNRLRIENGIVAIGEPERWWIDRAVYTALGSWGVICDARLLICRAVWPASLTVVAC